MTWRARTAGHAARARRATALPALALAALLALAACAPRPALAEDVPAGRPPAGDNQRDPLVPLVLRQHRYFRAHELAGVTMDTRYAINPSEAIRMGVVSQLLGYTELAKAAPAGTFATEVAAHADFLVSRLDTVRSHSPFDGMLGYSLVQAYEQTGSPAHLTAARTVLDELIAIPTYECVLNGGLMLAMATADWANLTADPVAAAKTSDIIAQLLPYQNADGSFPHWCVPSEDIHYTGWMAEELVLLERLTADPRIEPVLARMRDFIAARLDSTGLSHYEEPCPGLPGCTRYYDSQRSGCGYDYDTRGWTVEPAYSAQLLDHFGAPQYRAAMRCLLTLEHGGTFADKYGYIPPPSDPEYPWSIADTSVANMSINFWVLATIVTGRGALARLDAAEFADPAVPGHPGAAGPPAITLTALPPVAGRAALRFTLPAPQRVTLTLCDLAGRRVRTLVAGELAAGPHVIAWDGRDDAGRRCPRGVCFAALRSAAGLCAARVVVGP